VNLIKTQHAKFLTKMNADNRNPTTIKLSYKKVLIYAILEFLWHDWNGLRYCFVVCFWRQCVYTGTNHMERPTTY